MGGGPGSNYYTLMIGVAQLSSKYLGVKGTVITSGAGSGPQIYAMSQGETDFGTMADSLAEWAIFGTHSYEGKPVPNIRAVVGGHLTLSHAITRTKYGMKTPADLKGTGYTVSYPITSAILTEGTKAMLDFYGIKDGVDIHLIGHTAREEGFAGLKEGRIQVVIEAGSGLKQSSVYFTELERDTDMQFLDLSEDCVKYIHQKIPGYIPGLMAGGLYKSRPDPLWAFGTATGVFCDANMPDSFVYEICRLVLEQPGRADWLAIAPHHAEYVPEMAVNFLSPLHAGALKYYKDKGAWTDDAEKGQQEKLAKLGMDR